MAATGVISSVMARRIISRSTRRAHLNRAPQNCLNGAAAPFLKGPCKSGIPLQGMDNGEMKHPPSYIHKATNSTA